VIFKKCSFSTHQKNTALIPVYKPHPALSTCLVPEGQLHRNSKSLMLLETQLTVLFISMSHFLKAV